MLRSDSILDPLLDHVLAKAIFYFAISTNSLGERSRAVESRNGGKGGVASVSMEIGSALMAYQFIYFSMQKRQGKTGR